MRLATTAAIVGGATLVEAALGVVISVAVARGLGVEAYGSFGFALAASQIVSGCTLPGLDAEIVRRVALERAAGARLAAGAMAIKLGLGALALIAVVSAARAAGQPDLAVAAAALAGVMQVVAAVGATPLALVNALELGHLVAGPKLLERAVALGLVMGVLGRGGGLVAVLAAMLAAVTVRESVVLALACSRYGRPAWPQREEALELARTAVPISMATFFLWFYASADMLVVSTFCDARASGLYAASKRFQDALGLVPVVIHLVLYPRLCHVRAQVPEQFGAACSGALALVVMAGVPVGVGLALVARGLVSDLFGVAFAEAAPYVIAVAVATPFIAVIAVFWDMLNACGRGREAGLAAGLGALLALAFYVTLARTHGAAGVAAGLALAQLPMMALLAGALAAPLRELVPWGALAHSVVAAGAMAAAVVAVPEVHWPARVLVGIAVHAAVMVLGGGVARVRASLLSLTGGPR